MGGLLHTFQATWQMSSDQSVQQVLHQWIPLGYLYVDVLTRLVSTHWVKITQLFHTFQTNDAVILSRRKKMLRLRNQVPLKKRPSFFKWVHSCRDCYLTSPPPNDLRILAYDVCMCWQLTVLSFFIFILFIFFRLEETCCTARTGPSALAACKF